MAQQLTLCHAVRSGLRFHSSITRMISNLKCKWFLSTLQSNIQLFVFLPAPCGPSSLLLRKGSTINHSFAHYCTGFFSEPLGPRVWGNLLRQTTQDSTEKWSV